MSSKPAPGSRWQHYKGGLYEVVCVGTHTETNERLVIYRPVEGRTSRDLGSVWVRPLGMWNEIVNGVPRFKPEPG